jgi:putative addiction module antidote
MTKRASMTKPVKLIAIGNSTGVILPKEVLARMRVDQGDTLYISEGPDGVELRVHDPDFEDQIAVAREVMKRRRKALHELAK